MPEVIHTYLQHTTINKNIGGQPPGFADFLRGTICLYQFAKLYNFELKFSINAHPIFKLLNIPDELKVENSNDITHEILPPIEYTQMHNILHSLFKTGKSFSILTNAFFSKSENMNEEFMFIQKILKPSTLLNTYMNTLKNNINNIDFLNGYTMIHIRIGDNYLINNATINTRLFDTICSHINQIEKSVGSKCLVIADSYLLKQQLADLFITTNSKPIHTGTLLTKLDTSNYEEELYNNLQSTLAEFFLLSKSNAIYCLSFYGSGFSSLCSSTYSIPFNLIELDKNLMK